MHQVLKCWRTASVPFSEGTSSSSHSMSGFANATADIVVATQLNFKKQSTHQALLHGQREAANLSSEPAIAFQSPPGFAKRVPAVCTKIPQAKHCCRAFGSPLCSNPPAKMAATSPAAPDRAPCDAAAAAPSGTAHAATVRPALPRSDPVWLSTLP